MGRPCKRVGGRRGRHGSVANCSRPVCFKVLISKVRNSLAPLMSISTATRPAEADVEINRAPFGRVMMRSKPTGHPLLRTRMPITLTTAAIAIRVVRPDMIIISRARATSVPASVSGGLPAI